VLRSEHLYGLNGFFCRTSSNAVLRFWSGLLSFPAFLRQPSLCGSARVHKGGEGHGGRGNLPPLFFFLQRAQTHTKDRFLLLLFLELETFWCRDRHPTVRLLLLFFFFTYQRELQEATQARRRHRVPCPLPIRPRRHATMPEVLLTATGRMTSFQHDVALPRAPFFSPLSSHVRHAHQKAAGRAAGHEGRRLFFFPLGDRRSNTTRRRGAFMANRQVSAVCLPLFFFSPPPAHGGGTGGGAEVTCLAPSDACQDVAVSFLLLLFSFLHETGLRPARCYRHGRRAQGKGFRGVRHEHSAKKATLPLPPFFFFRPGADTDPVMCLLFFFFLLHPAARGAPDRIRSPSYLPIRSRPDRCRIDLVPLPFFFFPFPSILFSPWSATQNVESARFCRDRGLGAVSRAV